MIAYGRSGGIAVDVCEGGATIERHFSNARYGVGDGDGGEGGATTERKYSNACYGVGGAVVGNGFGDDDGR